MNPLDSTILKAEWVHSHLHVLDDEITSIFNPDGEGVPGQLDAQQSQYIFRPNIRKSTLDEYSLRIGDIAVNLRSALDHIAYQLALQTTKDIGILKRIYFPIFKERNNRTFLRCTQHFKPEARKKIDGFQPYNTLGRWPDPRRHPLWVMNELARIDKHRYLNVVPIMTTVANFDVPADGGFDVSFDDAGIVAVISGTFKPEEYLKPHVTFEPQIEITEPDLVIHDNFGYLHDACKLQEKLGIDLGMTFIDTAPVYGNGRAEEA
ncbi:MAG: hypothetical protein IH955_08960, partial [Chloroflexi bacterium]|nr:hypothetical protein [Chloroflexota bacterium]